MAQQYRNPLLTVDIIIETGEGVVLVERANPPHGWALPGGFVDYGESLEAAAVREALEETSLGVHLLEQFHVYSDPGRDPRHHTVTVVYIARADGRPQAASDARRVAVFPPDGLPSGMAFDHGAILADYRRYRSGTPKEAVFALGETGGAP